MKITCKNCIHWKGRSDLSKCKLTREICVWWEACDKHEPLEVNK